MSHALNPAPSRRGCPCGRLSTLMLVLFLALMPLSSVEAATAGALSSAPAQDAGSEEQERATPRPDLDSRLYGPDGELVDPAIGELDTPRGTLTNLLAAAGGGDYRQAAKSLQLPEGMSAEQADDIAGKLTYVLRQRLEIRGELLPDRSDGLYAEERDRGAEPRGAILLAEFDVDGKSIPIRLVRTGSEDGIRWLFDAETVKGTETLYARTGMGRLVSGLPFYRVKYELLGTGVFRLGLAIVAIALSVFVAWLLRHLGLRLADRFLPRGVVGDWLPLLRHYVGPGLFALMSFALLGSLARPLVLLPPRWNELYDSLVFVGIVGSVTWLLINTVRMYFSAYGQRKAARLEERSVFLARTYRTKMTVLSRALVGAIFFVGAVVALSTFDWFASLGLSLLASAGLISVVIGIGAQRSIANLFAGLQVALTQPMRIGDMVIFKGEWGYIENITYTYVVIRIWDLRRLTVPTTMLIDEPVYNYSYADKEGDLRVYGEVYLYLDYTVPVDRLREKLIELVRDDDNHDGEVASVLVTGCREWSVEVRALVSATDGLAAWYLRCKVREGLIAFLQELDGGRYLPRSRVLLEREPEETPDQDARPATDRQEPSRSQEEARGVGERPGDLGGKR